ncbi:MAG: glucosaminidase domain-containing protein [Bacteroidaceae bacterium]|nr:glucosaminidase domain-containing protein [Bacteroidaceae bacterium]
MGNETTNAARQQRPINDYDNYIRLYASIAVEQMQRHGIPASITLAQGLLESGAGKSRLAVRGNNHFGIKCHDWTGNKIYKNDDEDNECFRSYNSAKESFEDHSLFLKRKRYEQLFTYKITDYRSWAKGLKACGYATSPTYAQSLINIIEDYQLYRFDNEGLSTNQSQGQGKINGIPYVLAYRGDNFKTISARTGISYRKLAKYNERDKNDNLQEGEIVFLKKKARKGDKQYKNMVYVVKPGDSMYSISQLFGIRLKRLYKINKLSPEDQIAVGQRLWLR